jgi:mannose-6-phosphate isomerase-like protein (cupin superfamily)
MKLEKKDARKYGWPGLRGWAYKGKDDFSHASVAYAEVTGKHGRAKDARSDIIYFVIDGKGEFSFGKERIAVKKSDVIIVPKNTAFDFWAKGGTMKLCIVHCPAFDPAHYTRLD